MIARAFSHPHAIPVAGFGLLLLIALVAWLIYRQGQEWRKVQGDRTERRRRAREARERR